MRGGPVGLRFYVSGTADRVSPSQTVAVSRVTPFPWDQTSPAATAQAVRSLCHLAQRTTASRRKRAQPGTVLS